MLMNCPSKWWMLDSSAVSKKLIFSVPLHKIFLQLSLWGSAKHFWELIISIAWPLRTVTYQMHSWSMLYNYIQLMKVSMNIQVCTAFLDNGHFSKHKCFFSMNVLTILRLHFKLLCKFLDGWVLSAFQKLLLNMIYSQTSNWIWNRSAGVNSNRTKITCFINILSFCFRLENLRWLTGIINIHLMRHHWEKEMKAD